MNTKPNGQDCQRLAHHVAPWSVDHATPTPYVSTFELALRDARFVGGRDVESGALLETPTALWAGTLVYFALLDQIGKTLRPVSGRDVKHESRIERSLRQFAPKETTARQREAIHSLRNAFAHEFGLVNINQRRPEYTHAFSVNDAVGSPLIRWPARRWNGRLSTLATGDMTRVNFRAFGDLSERVVRSVRRHSNMGKLRSRVPLAELERRYAVRIAADL